MLSLVGTKVELTRRGHDSYFGCCPFHDERTPSFHVRPDEKHYHCFGCSESGDPFTFVMATEGLDFKGAMESLADRFGVRLETEEESPEAAASRERRERLYSLLNRTATYYERYLWEARDADGARDYLLGRGLSEEKLREFRVGYAPRSWDRIVSGSRHAGYNDEELLGVGLAQSRRDRAGELRDRFYGRIMFPTADARGRVRGFGARVMPGDEHPAKYLNTADGELYHKREVLYGIALARPAAAKLGTMVLAEGYTDVIALHQAGVTNAVGVMGTSLTAEQVSELVRTVRTLELCLDADNAGQEAMIRAAKLCADSGLELRVVPLPPGADPGELIQSEGPAALRDRVATSVPYVVFLVGRILDKADLDSAEGKDRAIAELRPVLAPIPASVLRDELIRRAAGRIGLTEARMVSLLGQAADRVLAAPGVAPLGPPVEQSARTPAAVSGPPLERSFLAMCLSAPDLGTAALERVDVDALFTSDLLRRVARHIKETGTRTPLDGVGAEDEQLLAALVDLAARAEAGQSVVSDSLEHARLLLERERLNREIRYRREHNAAGVAALAHELQDVLGEIGALVGRLERPA
jgi:DNA primase